MDRLLPDADTVDRVMRDVVPLTHRDFKKRKHCAADMVEVGWGIFPTTLLHDPVHPGKNSDASVNSGHHIVSRVTPPEHALQIVNTADTEDQPHDGCETADVTER